MYKVDKFSTRNEKLHAAYVLARKCEERDMRGIGNPYLVGKWTKGDYKPVFRLYYAHPDDMFLNIRIFWDEMKKIAPEISPAILKFHPENQWYAIAEETNFETDTPDNCYMIEPGYNPEENRERIKRRKAAARADLKRRKALAKEIEDEMSNPEPEYDDSNDGPNWQFPESGTDWPKVSDAALEVQDMKEMFVENVPAFFDYLND